MNMKMFIKKNRLMLLEGILTQGTLVQKYYFLLFHLFQLFHCGDTPRMKHNKLSFTPPRKEKIFFLTE